MFEKTVPFSDAQNAQLLGSATHHMELPVGSVDTAADQPASGGDALRLMDWNELTARLNAARDLRHVLRRDARQNIEANGSSFADAAARYFRAREDDERYVNPVALEQPKSSPGITLEGDKFKELRANVRGHTATGDARED